MWRECKTFRQKFAKTLESSAKQTQRTNSILNEFTMPPAMRANRLLRILHVLAISGVILKGVESLPRPQNDYMPNYAATLGAPMITPLQEEIVVEVNSNYTLRCEANEDIVWISASGVKLADQQTFQTGDPSRPYGNLLYFRDVQAETVGAYYCVKEHSITKELSEMIEGDLIDLVNENQASSIYMFVNDPNRLLVPIEVPVGHAQQFQDYIVPCKPTMPDTEVLMTTYSDLTQVIANSTAVLAATWQIQTFGDKFVFSKLSYNPKFGFTVHSVNKFHEVNCVIRKGVEDYELEVFDTAIDKTESSTALQLTVDPQALTTTNPSISTTPAPAPTEDGGGLSKIPATSFTNHPPPSPHSFEHTAPPHDHRLALTPSSIGLTSLIGDGFDFGFGEPILDDENASVAKSESTSSSATTSSLSSTSTSGDDSEDDYQSDSESDSSSSSSSSVSQSAPSDGDGQRALSVPQRLRKDVSSEERTTRLPSFRRQPLNSNIFDNSRTFATTNLKKPIISSACNNHAVVGESFNLTCDIEIQLGVRIKVNWDVPEKVDANRYEVVEPYVYNRTLVELVRSVLTVKKAELTDSGTYKCTVNDNSQNVASAYYSIKIMEPGASYINIREPNNHYDINVPANNMISMVARVEGYPQPSVSWFRPDGQSIEHTKKYNMERKGNDVGLMIFNASLEDSGTYTVNASNGDMWKELKFQVVVRDVPKVYINDLYSQLSDVATVACRVVSSTPTNVSFIFTECTTDPRWPSCTNNKVRFDVTSHRPGNSSIESIYELKYNLSRPGIVQCEARNKMTNKRKPSTDRAHIFISDINGNMTVFGVDEDTKIARDDVVNITCVALAYFFDSDLEWYRNGQLIEPTQDIQITTTNTRYSYGKSLVFTRIQDANQGTYECRAKYLNDPEEHMSQYSNIYVNEPVHPSIASTNMDSNVVKRNISDTLQLVCQGEGIPKPTIQWFKDSELLDPSDRLQFSEDNSTLILPYMGPKDEGTYKCVVANRLGQVENSVEVQITDMPGITTGWVLAIIAVSIILFVLVIYLAIRVRQERAKMRELKAAGLANFEEGAVEQINQAMTLDEQAELLPYDRNFEFPRDKLKLGKQLGAGAFGVVLKATAEGIKVDEAESVVAVKMVKRTADNEVIRALVSELKIMVHLGQHLNVVNLLGAVTKNIGKRELMVIVEYCRYGNVQNLLLKNRKYFINQIHPETDKIDPTISVQRFPDNFEMNRDGLKYVNVAFSNHHYMNEITNMNNNYTHNGRRNSDNDPRSGTRAGRPGSAGYLRESDLYEGPVNSCATEKTMMTTIPEDEDHIMSNNSIQPAWRSNYKTDSTEAMPITTSDLVSWAFQVSRGMDYLSSRKVLHGDLAARNILLCEDNVVKICDFGLARTMYKSDNYKKQGDARLPIKWLALESLSDHVFSTYTDVWSFGIVLWEFFSLAKVPYPDIGHENLYAKLKDGYRMEKPAFANDEIYDIMLECWSTNYEKRPLFNELEKRFGRMLSDEVASHYMDLNDPYMRTNDEYMKRNQTDYLALMGSPYEMAPSVPKYVNGKILPEIRIQSPSEEYLQMNPNTGITIFSPTRPKDYTISPRSGDVHYYPNSSTSFTFPPDITAPTAPPQHSPTLVNNMNSPINKNRKKDLAPQPEEIPMLNNSQPWAEDDADSPDAQRKVFQPTRSTPTPTPRKGTAPIAETEFTNDYVNVDTGKKHLNNNVSGAGRVPDAFSNPSYQILKTFSGDTAK